MIDFLRKQNILFAENISLKKLSSFRIGGNAALVIYPDSKEQVSAVLRYMNECGEPYIILGNGTNVLFSDVDIAKPIIKTEKLNNISVDGEVITAGAGCLNVEVALAAYEHSLTGFEFAHGIPGSIGGAVFMNAGAYGGEMKDVVIKTSYINANGDDCLIATPEEHQFGYRKSVFTSDDFICETVIRLSYGNKADIREKTDSLSALRRSKQPLEFPSAGSVFKRPEGFYTGKLIDDCGLKGYSIGGAKISEKHSGFIINSGNATAADVKALIKHIKNTVFDTFGVKLETEIRIIENSAEK